MFLKLRCGLRGSGCQFVAYRLFHQSRNIVYGELAHQAGTIGVYRLGAEGKASGDFLGPHAFHEEREHPVLRSGVHGLLADYCGPWRQCAARTIRKPSIVFPSMG